VSNVHDGAEPILVVEDLHAQRGEAHVLQGVSFAVAPRRVTAVLGRNGAGKTTTLMAIMGLLPARGRVTLDGGDVLGLSTHELVRRGVGYVPEDREVFTQLTVLENLRLAARTPESTSRLEIVYELFPELEQRGRQRAGTLSGGQQQMVAIARSLLNPNRLLLIDEPSKGLAPIVISKLVAALETVVAETTVLLVEQNLRVAAKLATDALILDHGAIVYAGPMSTLLGDDAMTRQYLGVSSGSVRTSGTEPTDSADSNTLRSAGE
jgi:branched-chain amino acid transport system ATP-binding protein